MLWFLGGIAFLILGYFTYGRFVERIVAPDDRPTPALECPDGVDYVPLPKWKNELIQLLNIAGVGPVIGVIAGIKFGKVALLIIPLGCVFAGAVHDFLGGMASLRDRGANLPKIIRDNLGRGYASVFSWFMVGLLLLVVAVFINVPSNLIKTRFFGGDPGVFWWIVGLIFLYYIAATLFPVDKIIGRVYPVFGALLLLGSFALLVALVVAGFRDPSILCESEAFLQFKEEVFNAHGRAPLFPLLFVTIACGACSGFHAIVASGTSSKQIAKESHTLPVGYGGMLVEGILATMTIISVCYLNLDELKEMLSGANKVPPAVAFAKGLAQFSTKLGINYAAALNFVSLSISAFMLTSLDTAARLARFIWQEMVLPKGSAESSDNADAPQPAMSPTRQFLASRWTSTTIIILLGGWLVLSGEGNHIWPIFGAGNQLLAALTLLAVSLWLMRTKRPVLFALLPMFFMLLISGWALVILIMQNINKNWSLVFIAAFLLVMAIGLLLLSVKKMKETKAAQKQA
jgi:carbon starvation protein CstA